METMTMRNMLKRLSIAVLLAVALPAPAKTVKYYHLDALGSVRVVTDQAGAVVERHDYLPFGEECTTGGCASNPGLNAGEPRKFTGKERDKETGLDYFGARYYAAKAGRFTAIDPVYTWRENLVDPQRWNRYTYVRNNPLRYVDPDGRDSKDLERAAQGAAAASGAAMLHDSRVRAQYADAVRQLSPSDSAGRTAAKSAARTSSTPVGAALAEAMRPLSGEAGRLGGNASRSNVGVNRAMVGAATLGKGLLVAGAGISIANVAMVPEGESGRIAAQEAGAWAGALSFGTAGAKGGAVLGTAIGGPPGGAVGAVVGGLGGAVGGAFVGAQAGNNLYDAAQH